tara:strand:- start:528 stop:710 length:183 start_codon:yes stop_codon:yes gene_type:complete
MKTKWGSCNPCTPRLWFSLTLVRVLHELRHLIDAPHGEHFNEALDAHLPNWRDRRIPLNL